MQNIFVSELLTPEEMREISASFGIELIRFSIADELDRLEAALAEVDYACPLTLHGPFMDLNPATWDSRLRGVVQARFHQAHIAAKALGAEKLIFHTGFVPRANFIEGWAPRVADFFSEFMEGHDGIAIALENVYDPLWEPILEVWRRVDHPRFGLCLDAGHAHCYSRQPVTEWAEGLLPALTHIHLHDNHGSQPFAPNPDEHLAIGEGSLPFEALMAVLRRKPSLTYTVECASKSAALRSVEALKSALTSECK